MKLNIGENIRRLRREHNMTQETLAEKLGVSFQSVSRWENSATYPDMEFLPALARIFSVSVDDLIGCGDRPTDSEMEAIMNDFRDALDDKSLDNAAIIERIRALRRDHIGSEHNWRIFEDIRYTETERWRDPAVMEELRITAREILAYPHPEWLKNSTIVNMSVLEDDAHIDAFLGEYAADRDLSRTTLCRERFLAREEWDALEVYRQNRFFRYIRDLLGDFGFWRNPGKPADVWECRWINERKITILHTICDTVPDAEHPVSGDGSVDIWAPDRVWLGIRHACYLASTGEPDAAFVYLEDAVSLAEQLFALPEGTERGCGCRSLSHLSLTLCCYPADDARAVKFNRYPADSNYDLGFWGSPLHSSGIYHALTAEHGWEWFDPIRDDPRYASCTARVRALMG